MDGWINGTGVIESKIGDKEKKRGKKEINIAKWRLRCTAEIYLKKERVKERERKRGG